MARRPASRAPHGNAISLHLGLNAVDPVHYAGWAGELTACEFDAEDMASIAASSRMASTVLLTKNATRKKTLAALRAASKAIKPGGYFFLTYSGHGGQVPDVTGEEDDKKDETWCLYDGELLDDELYYELSRFKEGVRILVLSDSCHSGTVTRDRLPEVSATATDSRSKMMPFSVAARTYRENRAFYDGLQQDVARAAGGDIADPDTMLAAVTASPRRTRIVKDFKPAVILISGCQDNQTSLDGAFNGAFTEQLLLVWNNGAFKGSYTRLHQAIVMRMPSTQTPNFFTLGPVGTFVAEQPFTI